jgi:acetamidase/formamidase
MTKRNIISSLHSHYGWDNSLEPVMKIDPGDTVEFDTIDAGGGQINKHSTVADISTFDFNKLNPTFGPVYIDGAEPGDAIEITIQDIKIADWGWTANIPGFGLLADRFPDPALYIWDLATSSNRASFAPGGEIPLRPFPGILGNSLPTSGCHSVVNPRQYGGNMDTKDITVGTKLLLPVGVTGALFSCGDGHAAQGDGEICGTAIETPMKITIKFDLIKDAQLKYPRFSTPAPASNHLDQLGYEVTMGIGSDLMTCARNAVNDMVDFVAKTYAMREVDAYMLLSVCADLRINEIVDAPNWVVSCYLPKIIFGEQSRKC